MSQMERVINRLEFKVQEKLPSQFEVNPKNISAMTLRSEKEVEGPKLMIPKDDNEDQIDKEFEEEGISNTNPKVISNL